MHRRDEALPCSLSCVFLHLMLTDALLRLEHGSYEIDTLLICLHREQAGAGIGV